jgi:mRNA-degrading endonuclease RelE of RelBE toxin-antitoxin system
VIVEFRQSFIRDLKRIRDRQLVDRIKEAIEQLEQTDSLTKLAGVKPIQGQEHYFRIRIGDYRLGLFLEGGTAVLVRFLHRKDIYRYFP